MNIFGRKEKKKEGRREPRFAGQWYCDDPKKLKQELDEYMASALKEAIAERERLPEKPLADLREGSLLAIIVPHAGYMFSGSTAAYAYQLASEFAPKRVFLMGPSHYVDFQGVALSPDKIFETPLGDLPLDRETIDELAQYPMFEEAREIHQREHSLELQLSFIRHALGEIPIVPMIVGALADITNVRMIGQVVRRYLKEGDLVVVSSDFTHYGPRYDYEPFSGEVRQQLKELDDEAFNCLKDGDLQKFVDFHNRTRCTICGFYPCAVLLSMLPESCHGNLLRYRTSRDTGYEDQENSVSYMAISFNRMESESWEPQRILDKDEMLNEREKADLLKLAREAVELYTKEGKILHPEDAGIDVTPVMKIPLGVFVTLFKKRKKPLLQQIEEDDDEESCSKRHDRELRGCIGYIWPIKTLVEAVIDNAVGACSKDYRFVAVREHELSELELEISVLTPLRRVDSIDEIEIGKHGIVLYAKGRQAVFLPHVATEFGWTLSETLDQLCIKAGLLAGEWKQDAKFDVFESIMFEEEHN